jgi:ATP-dependent Clp protease adaptor protein ClpS
MHPRKQPGPHGCRQNPVLARIIPAESSILFSPSTHPVGDYTAAEERSVISTLASRGKSRYAPRMAQTAAPVTMPDTEQEQRTDPKEQRDRGYLVICWNDPVNLMDYVTHVFQVVFGWPKAKAEHHMLQVHNAGKSLLARETFEKAEHYVHQLQGYGLHATMERDQ